MTFAEFIITFSMFLKNRHQVLVQYAVRSIYTIKPRSYEYSIMPVRTSTSIRIARYLFVFVRTQYFRVSKVCSYYILVP